MAKLVFFLKLLVSCSIILIAPACVSTKTYPQKYQLSTQYPSYIPYDPETDYAARLPQIIDTEGKKIVLVDPNIHVWGAYETDGRLVKAGIATAGGKVCPVDSEGEPTCITSTGTFYITNIGGEECYSKTYPRPNGGGLMPYCMFFKDGQALHGSPDPIVVEANVSHGCVRMRIEDAEWMVNNFARVGTEVRVLPY